MEKSVFNIRVFESLLIENFKFQRQKIRAKHVRRFCLHRKLGILLFQIGVNVGLTLFGEINEHK